MILLLLTLPLLIALSTLPMPAEPPPQAGKWKLVWQDEFDRKTIDTTKWNVLLREQSKHGELQYYLPDEVTIERGVLRIRSRVRSFGSQRFASGRLDTRGRFSTTYGRYEIRARLPAGRGLWPAHWLYPVNRDWPMEMIMMDAVEKGKERLIPEERPWYSEIDIMEFLGHERSVVYGTLHYYSYDGKKMTSSGTWRGTADVTEAFHTYALEWEPDSIRWYIDGQMFHATVLGIPHTPHYLILNTAIGGAWPGNPDSTTVLPQYHDIDYVRVYQRGP